MQDEAHSETEVTGIETDKIENNNVDVEVEEKNLCSDVPMDEMDAVVKMVEPENAGKDDKTFLDDINLETEEEKDDDDTTEPSDKINMIERKAVIINIDKTKSNDEIEDYLFDNYPEGGVKSFKVIRRIPYRVIVVFESKEQCEEFLAGPILRDDVIGFKNKMKKLGLAEFRNQAAERRKTHEKIVEGLVVSCAGFDPKETNETLLAYMKDNHEEVSKIDMKEDGKVMMTFVSKTAATRFAGLTYVKCRGHSISRTALVAVQKFLPDRTPLVNGTNQLNKKRKLATTNQFGSSFKLTGFQSSSTTYKTIQESLHMIGLAKTEVQFVRYCAEKREAVVTLRSGDVSQVVNIFKQRPVYINKDKVSAEIVKTVPGETFYNKPKRFKSVDNLQKNKIRAWTHY